jgi:hypothetical protein
MTTVALICLTVLFLRGTIFKWIRSIIPELFNCALCTGFWIGFLFTAWKTPTPWPVQALPSVECGVRVGVGALVLWILIGLLEEFWLLLEDVRKKLKSSP